MVSITAITVQAKKYKPQLRWHFKLGSFFKFLKAIIHQACQACRAPHGVHWSSLCHIFSRFFQQFLDRTWPIPLNHIFSFFISRFGSPNHKSFCPERTDQVVGGSNICGEALCCMESFLVSRNGLKSFFLADGRMAQVNTLQQWRVLSCKNIVIFHCKRFNYQRVQLVDACWLDNNITFNGLWIDGIYILVLEHPEPWGQITALFCAHPVLWSCRMTLKKSLQWYISIDHTHIIYNHIYIII